MLISRIEAGIYSSRDVRVFFLSLQRPVPAGFFPGFVTGEGAFVLMGIEKGQPVFQLSLRDAYLVLISGIDLTENF